MITSFRLRLALLSALLAGMALAVFGVTTWFEIRKMKLERIDSDVRTHAEREANRNRDNSGWQRTEANIISEIGIRDKADLLLLVESPDENVVYRSANWPPEVVPQSLPWPDRTANRRTSPPPPPQPQDHATPQLRQGTELPRPKPPATASAQIKMAGHNWRVGLASADTSRVVVAVDAATIESDMKGVRNAFLIAMPVILVLIGVGAWLFSGRSLQPIHELMAATRRVTAEGLDQRISAKGEDKEFVELIEVYNGMLERLQRSFQHARRFSADAAHELKTPLAILQGQLERAIQLAEDGSVMQSELTSILDEVRRLSTISRKLLLLSQADTGRLNLHLEPVDLTRTVDELLQDAEMLAPDLKVCSVVEPGLNILADGNLLVQVLHNLVSNAIKYNLKDGWLRIEAHRNSATNSVHITVANSSYPLRDDEIEKVFERFFRAQSATDNNIEGVGLGLSVSREIARAHGGDIVLEWSAAISVVTVKLSLPCAEKRSAAASTA